MGKITAGAAQKDISPKDSQFLFGYPHVERYSTGIHDRILSSALYLCDGNQQVLFIANDIIFITKAVAEKARGKISAKTGIAPENIMITATHTHSAPHVVDYISNEADPAVPKADQNYVDFMCERIVLAGVEAYENSQPAKIGIASADDTGVGTNRRNPAGPADHEVPVLAVKNGQDEYLACMIVCSMHPTVMHEDSKLVSGDFPGMSRLYLQENAVGKICPVLHHTGPAGNQSPRHVTKANTFEEADRLGRILGGAVKKTLDKISYTDETSLAAASASLDGLPRKTFPSVAEAGQKLKEAVDKLEHLRSSNAPRQETRTAECDWFGAEETLTLAKAAEDGRIEQGYKNCMPAEIQVIKIGEHFFAGWPGEIFIEYALDVKKKSSGTFTISLANGELQGYVVTKEAAEEGGYEASNAMFSYETGDIFVKKTLELIEKLK